MLLDLPFHDFTREDETSCWEASEDDDWLDQESMGMNASVFRAVERGEGWGVTAIRT